MDAPTVLLVEDEPEIVGLLADFLAVEGFGVIAAGDAIDAIAAIDGRDVDCVLLDVMLPSASGFDVCRRIRERSDVPLLFLSARGEDGTSCAASRSAPTTTSSSRRHPRRSSRA
jgi:DNA-binding response OmpR family regulator